jgi:hypothetical protein
LKDNIEKSEEPPPGRLGKIHSNLKIQNFSAILADTFLGTTSSGLAGSFEQLKSSSPNIEIFVGHLSSQLSGLKFTTNKFNLRFKG